MSVEQDPAVLSKLKLTKNIEVTYDSLNNVHTYKQRALYHPTNSHQMSPNYVYAL